MSSDLVNQLQGSRAEVENAATEVREKLKQILKRGTSSVAAYALKYDLQVLRPVCLALQANCYKHADIYCDIVETLLPHVEPCAEKPVLWETHLDCLRYIHHALCREQTSNECQRIYALISGTKCRLHAETDYKIYFRIHVCHFNMCYGQLKETATARMQLYRSLEALGALFDEMRQQKLRQNFSYTGFMGELNAMLLYKRSSAFLRFLGTLPQEHVTKMSAPLFKLVGCNSLPTTEPIIEYLSAFLALFQLDICAASLQQQLAPQLLRLCCQHFQHDSMQRHALQLLYTYVKMMYVSKPMPEFRRTYTKLCKEFVDFLKVRGAAVAKEQWFMDCLVTLQHIHTQLHHGNNQTNSFALFWQQFNGEGNAEACASHLELLRSSMLAALHVDASTLAASCSSSECKGLSKHLVLSFGMCAVAAYSSFEQPKQAETFTESMHKHLVHIVRNTVAVADALKCMSRPSMELSLFPRHLAKIIQQMATPAQMTVLLQLVVPIQQIRRLIPVQEMNLLLRRINKVGQSYCGDPELAAQLQSAYIASVVCAPVKLCRHISYFYQSLNRSQKSVYELHEASPLRNPLTPAQKRQLYDADMCAVTGYYKSNVPLLQSLLRCRQHDYQFVLLARHMRTDKDLLRQLDDMRSKLRRLAFQQPLTRLQHLVAAHATANMLDEALKAKKTKIPIKETVENSLEELFIRHKRLDVHVGSEKRLVDLATAVMAGFAAFFNKADEEPIDSNEALIDWEALIEDATLAAVALTTMGYMPQADEAWHLLLRITRLLGDRFDYLRAVSHFLARHEPTCLDLGPELAHAEQLLDELWPQLHSFQQKRHHTVVLLCLCYLAHYYARSGRVCQAQLLLLHVQRLRMEFKERRGKCEIVLITLQTVRFRMLYQQRRSSCKPTMPTALRLMDKLIDSMRNFSYISSVDTTAFMLLICELVRACSECSSNRLGEGVSLVKTLLNITLQDGLALRSVEVLTSWLWANLQMENVERAQSKVRLIEHLLCVKPLREFVEEPGLRSSALPLMKDTEQSNHMNHLVGKMMMMHLHQGAAAVEPIRKQNQLEVGPLHVKALTPSPTKLKLLRYVQLEEAHPVLRESVQLQCIYFFVGCLHARLHFLNRKPGQLDDFYEQANAWLQVPPGREYLDQMTLVQHLYQANYLRANQKHQAAIKHIKTSLANVEKLQRRVDLNYQYNLLLQLRTAQMELQQKLYPVSQVKQLRRALHFDTSPDDISKPVELGANVKTVKPPRQPSRKPVTFQIYTEDEASSSSSGSSSSTERKPASAKSRNVDLNACRLIDVIDLSDDEEATTMQAAAPVQRVKSAPPASTAKRPGTLRKTPTVHTLASNGGAEQAPAVRRAGRLQRCKTVDERSSQNIVPDAEPAKISTRGRPRRQNTQVPQPSSTDDVSSRRRQRN